MSKSSLRFFGKEPQGCGFKPCYHSKGKMRKKKKKVLRSGIGLDCDKGLVPRGQSFKGDQFVNLIIW